MKGDFTRFTYKKKKHYTAVLNQQGRVELDADDNENAMIQSHLNRQKMEDIIGRSGVPVGFKGENKDAYKIGHPFLTLDDKWNFPIGSGHLYLKGQLCEMERIDGNDQLYLGQIDYPGAPEINIGNLIGKKDLVYLDTWQRHVTSVEDPDIREVALGGPDTCSRLRTIAQVKVLSAELGRLSDNENNNDISELLEGFNTCKDAREYLDDTFTNLENRGRLKVDKTLPDAITDPCKSPYQGGYSALENRLYRVEIHKKGSIGTNEATYKWSTNNAAQISPVIDVNTDATDAVPKTISIKIEKLRIDNVTIFIKDDIVELSDEYSELHFQRGILAKIKTQPKEKDGHAIIEIIENGPDAIFNDIIEYWKNNSLEKPKLRKWDNWGAVENMNSIDLGVGVFISFEGSDFWSGDSWTFSARTADRKVDWPEVNGNTIAMPPMEIEHYYWPLALITWDPANSPMGILDCRRIYRPLNKQNICCSVIVGDGKTSFGDKDSIEDALNHLCETGGEICLLPGLHKANVNIVGRHDITIRGCGKQSVVIPEGSNQEDPIFHIVDSHGIVLKNMDIISAEGKAIEMEGTTLGALQDIEIYNNRIFSYLDAINVIKGLEINIHNNEIGMMNIEGAGTGICMLAEDSIVERNRVGVISPDLENIEWITEDTPQPIHPCVVALWHMNEGAGTTINDATTNNNNGVIDGAAWVEGGRFNKALEFNGIDNGVNVPDAPGLDLQCNQTIEAWINPYEVKNQVIIRKGDTNAPYLLKLTGNGEYVFSLNLDGQKRTVRYHDYPTNEWIYLVGTYNGSKMKIYINGEKVAEKSVTGLLGKNDSDILIGTKSKETSNTFNGKIDEIVIWRRALTKKEIKKYFESDNEHFPSETGGSADSEPTGIPYLATGGIQVSNGSENIKILENKICGGAGNGITLGTVFNLAELFNMIELDYDDDDEREASVINSKGKDILFIVRDTEGEPLPGIQFSIKQDGVSRQEISAQDGLLFAYIGEAADFEIQDLEPNYKIEDISEDLYISSDLDIIYCITMADSEEELAELDDFLAFIYDVQIENNDISNMLLSGIGIPNISLDGLTEEDMLKILGIQRVEPKLIIWILLIILFGIPFSFVVNLKVLQNHINRCLLGIIDYDQTDDLSLKRSGGISLGLCDNILINENLIENNGTNHQPVCGIFILYTDQVEIHHNRIIGNGQEISRRSSELNDGIQGGIVIFLATSFSTSKMLSSSSLPIEEVKDIPKEKGGFAARIHDNIINQPFGRALTMGAFGPVSILNNKFNSEASAPVNIDEIFGPIFNNKKNGESIQPDALDKIVGTVLVINFGGLPDLITALDDFGKAQIDTVESGPPPQQPPPPGGAIPPGKGAPPPGAPPPRAATPGGAPVAEIMNSEPVIMAKFSTPTVSIEQLLPFFVKVGHSNPNLPNGNIIFNDNQISMGERNKTLISQLIVTLDDLGYNGNQSDILSETPLINTLLGGVTLRAGENRFKELYKPMEQEAKKRYFQNIVPQRQISLVSLSFLMNNTNHNQGNHCIIVDSLFELALPYYRVSKDNQVSYPSFFECHPDESSFLRIWYPILMARFIGSEPD